jgi:hypothetical protein
LKKLVSNSSLCSSQSTGSAAMPYGDRLRVSPYIAASADMLGSIAVDIHPIAKLEWIST